MNGWFPVAKKNLEVFNLDEFSGPFRAETDIACAVLGAALLDVRLELFFRPAHSDGSAKRLGMILI